MRQTISVIRTPSVLRQFPTGLGWRRAPGFLAAMHTFLVAQLAIIQFFAARFAIIQSVAQSFGVEVTPVDVRGR